MIAVPSVGEELPVLTRDMSLTRLVRYAAATWDWHRLHYDTDHAKELGLAGPVVDGQMFGALLATQVIDAFGPKTRIESMSLRFTAIAFAGEVADVTGVIAEASESSNGFTVVIDQMVSVGDRLCAIGSSKATLVR